MVLHRVLSRIYVVWRFFLHSFGLYVVHVEEKLNHSWLHYRFLALSPYGLIKKIFLRLKLEFYVKVFYQDG